MTLIELMVAITLVMLFLVVGAVSLGSIGAADTDTTADVMAGAMRYTSTLAVHNNKTYRLVIDMPGRRWWVESAGSDDPCARFVPDDADPPADAADISELEDEPEDEGVDVPLDVDASYAETDDDLLKGDFEPDTTISAVLTSHHREPQSEGKVAIYFYPNGYAERAWVWVAQEREDDGRVIIEPEVMLALEALGSVERFSPVKDADDFEKELRR